MSKKERMIFARDRWEFATIEPNSVTAKPQWIRRDKSFICDVGDEISQMEMPAPPATKD